MSYENKEYILQFFEGVHEEENRAELIEVYLKAKAWDRTQELLEECTHQTPGDDYEVDWYEFEIKIDEVISDYESGEKEVYKCTCGAKYWSMDNYKEHLTNCFEA